MVVIMVANVLYVVCLKSAGLANRQVGSRYALLNSFDVESYGDFNVYVEEINDSDVDTSSKDGPRTCQTVILEFAYLFSTNRLLESTPWPQVSNWKPYSIA